MPDSTQRDDDLLNTETSPDRDLDLLAPDRPLSSAETGVRFGKFTILGEIGRGGMGVVHRAVQRNPDREIALKMISDIRFGSPSARRRLELEAEATASLQHPNIITLLEAGEINGQAYLALPYVEGSNLAEQVKAKPADLQRDVQLMIAIVSAVSHAHRHGILHRDLKPSNILLDREGRPFVTDFGLAKIVGEDQDLTVSGAVLGSPAFAPPEQVRGDTGSISVASDVYGLGAILYNLLTRRPPFRGESTADTLRQVTDEDPVRPREINHSMDTDLETVCLKCLEKEPQRRYASAADLQTDLENWLSGRPVNARPVGTLGRFAKWARRNPTVAFLSSLLLLALITGIATTTYQWRKARTFGQQILEQFLARSALDAEREYRDGHLDRSMAIWANMLRRDRNNPTARDRIADALLNHPYSYPAAPPLQIPEQPEQLLISPSAEHLLSIRLDPNSSKIHPLDVASSSQAVNVGGKVRTAAFSSDGKRIAVAQENNVITCVDAHDGTLLSRVTNEVPPMQLAFSPNGRQLVVRGDQVEWVSIVDLDTAVVTKLETYESTERLGVFTRLLRFIDRGRQLATIDRDGNCLWWNATNATPTNSYLAGHWRSATNSFNQPVRYARHPAFTRNESDRINILAADFTRNGDRVATFDDRGRSLVCDLTDGRIAPLNGVPTNRAVTATIDPGDRWLTTLFEHGKCLVWKLDDLRFHFDLSAKQVIENFKFSPSGQLLATVDTEQSVRVWDLQQRTLIGYVPRLQSNVLDYQFDEPQGRLLIALESGQLLFRTYGKPNRGYLHKFDRPLFDQLADNMIVLGSFGNPTLHIRDIHSTTDLAQLDLAGPLHSLAASRNTVAATCWNPFSTAPAHVQVWRRNSSGEWNLIVDRQVSDTRLKATLSDDGEQLAVVGRHGIHLWPALEQPAEPTLIRVNGHKHVITFDPRAQFLATQADGNRVLLLAMPSGSLIAEFNHETPPRTIAFAPNSRWVATSDHGNHAFVWSTTDGQSVTPPLDHGSPINGLLFLSHDDRLLSAGNDGHVKQWEIPSGNASGRDMIHDSPILHLTLDSITRRLLTTTRDNVVRLWDTDAREPRSLQFRIHTQQSDSIIGAGFADDSTVVTLDRRFLRLHQAPTLPAPVPNWLPTITESIAGYRIDQHEQTVPAVRTNQFATLTRSIKQTETGNPYRNLLEQLIAK